MSLLLFEIVGGSHCFVNDDVLDGRLSIVSSHFGDVHEVMVDLFGVDLVHF